MNPYSMCKVYGPYSRPDGRKHVICIYIDGSRKTVSFPKFLVEKAIGRLLEKVEEVHHVNGDFTDNRLDNLEIANKHEHAKLHVKRLVTIDIVCPVCKQEFSLKANQISNILTNRKRGKSKTGPYCSRECSGVGSDICFDISPEYYSLLSLQVETLEVEAANSVKPEVGGNTELGQIAECRDFTPPISSR